MRMRAWVRKRPARAWPPWLPAARTLIIVTAVTVVYYVLPLPGRMRDVSWTVLFCLGTFVLGAGIWVVIRRALLRDRPEQRVTTLVVLLCVTVLFFSYVDAIVAAIPGQFAELHTKTDALYFSVSTLATIGFGDVHPTGQLARGAVTVQIIFNLVFLGAALALISGLYRARATSRIRSRRTEHDGHDEAGGA
jgi:voltage-gated potassium channel